MADLSKRDLDIIRQQLRKPSEEQGLAMAEHMDKGNRPMILHTLAAVDPQPGEHLLEVGMGSGRFVPRLLALDPTLRYTGCDYSSDMVNIATEVNRSYVDTHRARFVQASVEKMPFSTASFDQVFTINTLYFWESLSAGLQEVHRVLKVGGTFMLSFRPDHLLRILETTQEGFAIYSLQRIQDACDAVGLQYRSLTKVMEPIGHWDKTTPYESWMLAVQKR